MNARDLYAQVRRKSLAIPCEVIRTVEYEYDSGEAFYIQTITIVKGNKHTENCIGIHTTCDLNDLDQVIEDAIKDNFERIYVYGGAK